MTIQRTAVPKLVEEYRAAEGVLATGMPQSTYHEQNAMTARARQLREQLEQCPWMLREFPGTDRPPEVVWKSAARRFIEKVFK